MITVDVGDEPAVNVCPLIKTPLDVMARKTLATVGGLGAATTEAGREMSRVIPGAMI